MSSLNSPSDEDLKYFLTNRARLQRWMPWLRMFRAFRISIDYQKMFLSILAVVIWILGSQVLSKLFFEQSANPQLTASEVSYQWPGSNSEMVFADNLMGDSETYIETRSSREHNTQKGSRAGTLSQLVPAPLALATEISWPFQKVAGSFFTLIDIQNSRAWWHSWMQLIWGLLVSAFFGGTVSRMAALELTGRGRSLIRDAAFSANQLPNSILAPAIAMFAFAMLWAGCWCSGLLGRIPLFGEFLLAIFGFVICLIGLIMALILIGLMLGWPLMFVSSQVENNDAFDSLSRSFSYLLNRPWYTVGLILISLSYGSILLFFVDWITRITISLSLSSVSSGMGREVTLNGLPSLIQMREMRLALFKNNLANSILHFWLHVVTLVPAAFTFSYFWTSSTIGYLLLRKSEDGTPIDEMELSDQPGNEKSNVPVVGIPATQNREPDS